MKYFVKIFVVTFLALICTYSNAQSEQKVAYLDMKYILNNSKAGKEAQDFLKDLFKKSQSQFSQKQNELRESEKDLLTKKTILSKEDYKKKTEELRKKVMTFQANRKAAGEKITKQRLEAKQALLKALNPILTSYVKENNVSLVIDKQNVVIGSDELDITETIIKKLDAKLSSLNLK